jgi:branched-chain amino acid transport system substrate-binding protein
VRKLVIVVLAVVILAAMLTGGCAKPAPSTPAPATPSAPTKTLDIGIATPLTGYVAWLGEMVKDTMQMMIDEQNEKGGVTIAGQKYMLNGIVIDDKMDIIVTKSVAEELVYEKKVKVIVGPTQNETPALQIVTEPNKVILFSMTATPGICGPKKPYTFFFSGFAPTMYYSGAAYIQKSYPEAKKVITMYTTLPDKQTWYDVAETTCARYGFTWLGTETFPLTTTDFTSIIPRVLAKKPDIVDTCGTGGPFGGLCCLLVKQLREAGFKGLIWHPVPPPPGVTEEVVPKEYRTLIVTGEFDAASPIVSQAYRDFYNQYIEKFREQPTGFQATVYNAVKPFLEFLNGQDVMDSTAWMEGFAKYRWSGLFGHEDYWVGKSYYGIDRILMGIFYVSEWTDGKMETKWQAPVPYELFTEK